MKLKSLLALLPILVIGTMNSCTLNSSESTVNSVDPTTMSTASITKTVSASYSYSASEIQLFELINTYRKSIGLPTLVESNYLSSKAEIQSNYMLSTNVLSHDNFEIRSQDIMKTIGAISVAENVAFNYSTAQVAFDAWLKSPGHKANIEGSYTHFGISIRVSAVDGRKYYTNIFAKI
jgi:uncharacterized protein YkwD